MSQAAAAPEDVAPPINLWQLVGYGALLVLMVVVIWLDDRFILNFMHVMSGVLWTGIDLFMGFFVGPALRSAPFEARRAVTMRLVPRTLFLSRLNEYGVDTFRMTAEEVAQETRID